MLQRKLIELDLVEGEAFDCLPEFILFVESLDKSKNENFKEAKTFLLCTEGPQITHKLATTKYNDIVEEVKETAPDDWIELTNIGGNRVLFRRSAVMSRQTMKEEDGGGSAVVLSFYGNFRVVHVKNDMKELRELLNPPEPADGPQPE